MFQTVIEAGADGTVIEHPGRDQQVADERRRARQAPHPLQRPRARRPAHGGPLAQRAAGARRADATRHTGHGLDRPAARVHRERRCLLHRAGAFSQWPEPLGLAALRDADVGAPVRRHRPPGVRRGRHPRRAAPDARPRDRAAVGAAGGHVRPGPRPRHRARRRLPQGVPAGRARPGQRRVHEQALPRRRPAEGRRGRALPLRPRAGLPRWAVRRPPQAVPADHRGRAPPRSCPTTACRSASRSTARRSRRSASATTARSSPACCASSSATTAWSSPTGSWSTTTTSATRCCRPAPGASSTSTRTGGWSSSSTPAPTSSAARSASRSCSTSSPQGRVTEARIDESARRLLAVKFRLGLFDDPYVDEDAAAATVGRQDFRDEGYAAQARVGDRAARNGGGRHAPVLPLRAGLRIYAENVSPEAVAAPRHPGGAARGRRRRARAADGAVRAALGPVPRVVVPPGLARLPAGPGRAPGADRRATARSSSTSCSTGRPCSRRCCRWPRRVVGSYGTSDDALLDALTGHDRAARAAAVRPAALDGAGARGTARTSPATTTRCSVVVTDWISTRHDVMCLPAYPRRYP